MSFFRQRLSQMIDVGLLDYYCSGLCLNQYDTRLYQTCGAEWPEGLRQLTPYLRVRLSSPPPTLSLPRTEIKAELLLPHYSVRMSSKLFTSNPLQHRGRIVPTLSVLISGHGNLCPPSHCYLRCLRKFRYFSTRAIRI